MRFIIDHRRSTGSVRDRLGPSSSGDVPWASGQSSPRSECSSSSRWFSLFSGVISEVTAPWRFVRGSYRCCCQPRRRNSSWPLLATSAATALSRLPLSRWRAVPRDGSATTATALHRSGSPCARECISEREGKRGGREREATARARIDIPVRFQFLRSAKMILTTLVSKKKKTLDSLKLEFMTSNRWTVSRKLN